MSFNSQAILFYGLVFEGDDRDTLVKSNDFPEDFGCEFSSLGNYQNSNNPYAVYIKNLSFTVDMDSTKPFSQLDTSKIKIPVGTNQKFRNLCKGFDVEYHKPKWHLAITSY